MMLLEIQAANYKITGGIQNEETKEPIPFSSVALYDVLDSLLVTGCISDEDGKFSLEITSPGKYYMEISFLGFAKHSISHIDLNEGVKHLDLGIIYIKPQSTVLDQIEVVAEREAIQYKVDRKVLNIDKMGVSPNAPLSEALEILPSVESDIEGNVSLRGSNNFQVLVDGKPSPLEGSEALLQYTADQIEKIEVITNPSAEYQADNTSGIINLILKKGEGVGFSGFSSLGVSAGVNHFQPYNISTTLSFRQRKYSLTGRFNSNDRRYDYIFSNRQRRTDGLDLDLLSTNRVPWKAARFSLDFDYFLNENHTLTLAGRIMNLDNGFDIQRQNHPVNEPSISPFFARVKGLTDRYTQAFSVHEHWKISEKQQLKVLLTSFNQVVNQDQTFVQYPNLDGSEPNAHRSFDTGWDHDQIQFKIDYTLETASGSKFETGLNSIVLKRGNTVTSEEFRPAVIPISQTLFETTSQIHAGYATLTTEIWNMNVKGGLRIEHYDRHIAQVDSEVSYPYRRLNLFPSFHLVRKFDRQGEFKLSYTGRIRRPSILELRPYIGWSDNVSSWGGNPNLIPARISAMEGSYMRWFDKVPVTLESYYRNVANEITNGSRLEENGERIASSPVNIDRSSFYGTEAMIDIKVNEGLKSKISGTYFRNKISGFLFTEYIHRAYNGWRLRMSNDIKIHKDLKLVVNGFYNSRILDAQREVSSRYWVNLAMTTNFNGRKGLISINVRDVFGTDVRDRTISGDGFTNTDYYRPPRQIVSLNVSYKFNGFKNKDTQFEFED